MRVRWQVVVTSLAVLTAGCDAMVDADYAGEPTVRLQGAATSSSHADLVTSTGVKAAAVWQGIEYQDGGAFTRLPLRMEFPVFWIDVLSPPDDGVAFTLGPGEPPIAEAYLHIVKPDTGAQALAGDFLASDFDHALLYVSATPAPGGLTAQYLGGAPAPGFHLMSRTATDALTLPQQGLVERCVASAPPGVLAVSARAGCTARRLYQLAPASHDLETILAFHVRASGP
jgi:hypothetical protein